MPSTLLAPVRAALPELERAGLSGSLLASRVPMDPAGGRLASTAILTGAALAGSALLIGALAMYHRIDSGEALESPARASVLAIVRRQDRVAAGDVARELGVHPKTARYHLDLLVSFSLLVRENDGTYRLPGTRTPAAPSPDDAIVETVRLRPGISMAELARVLAMSKSTAQERVTRLLLSNRLESRRTLRARGLYTPAEGSRLPSPVLAPA
jgi:predicted transcriptional regulator